MDKEARREPDFSTDTPVLDSCISLDVAFRHTKVVGDNIYAGMFSEWTFGSTPRTRPNNSPSRYFLVRSPRDGGVGHRRHHVVR
jgi:hypothetical protein